MTESTIERTFFSLEVCVPEDTAWKPDFSLQNVDFLTVNEQFFLPFGKTGTERDWDNGTWCRWPKGRGREGEGKGKGREGVKGEGRGGKVFIIFRIRLATAIS